MPKRVGYLYEKMCDKELIKHCIYQSAKRKHHRFDVKKVLDNIDKYVDKTYDMLVNETYYPATPRISSRYDHVSQKTRDIYIIPFWPDGVIQMLMVTVMQPTLEKGMYHWSCAAIPNRGGSRAEHYVKRAFYDKKGTKYIAKFDIRKFYPSVDHEKLMKSLDRKIKDKRFLLLVSKVVDSCPKGLAIGFYICQWLANYFLEPLDRFMCGLPGVDYCVRYMDDVVLMGRNKKLLHKALIQIQDFLKTLGLEMKGDWQVFPSKARALDFVGIRFFRSYCIMRKRTFLRFIRQCRRALKRVKAGKRIAVKQAAALLSRVGIVRRCNCHKARVKYYDPIGEHDLKEVIRIESKRRLRTDQRLYA